jgi:hypothetical protein
MDILFALLTVRLLKLQFTASQSGNPDVIFLRNDKGNSIYLRMTGINGALGDRVIEIDVYKVSSRCYHKEIKYYDLQNKNVTVDSIAEDIKTKLKLTTDINKDITKWED